MAPKPIPPDAEMRSFATASAFETFLEREHDSAPEVHLKLARKASGIPSITHEEAIEVALCFGWIDGWGKGLDDAWRFIRFTPRRPKSIWSKKNVQTVSRLLDEGRMRPSGIAAVEAAKTDGRWDRAYDGTTMPDDFASMLTAQPEAKAFFTTLTGTQRYAVLWRVQTASPAVRTKKMETLVQALIRREVPGGTTPKATAAAPNKVVKARKTTKTTRRSTRKKT